MPPDIAATAKEIIGALARLIGDKCMAHRQNLQEQIDRRMKQEINEKKLAMGSKRKAPRRPAIRRRKHMKCQCKRQKIVGFSE